MTNRINSSAQILLPTNDLSKDMHFLQSIGFKLLQIFPADDPAVAILLGHGLRIKLDKNATTAPAQIEILSDTPENMGDGSGQFKAPNGSIFNVIPKTYELEHPDTQHKFEVRQLRDAESWVIGRAGMLYRDLIPDRLGGSIIASHIRIPEGGPVPDMVHYHTIGFQFIYCYQGWVKLVYEDQGEPFILNAGDCVTQPPEIRHQVLEASDGLEVIEIGVPSEHMTTIDHEMTLPTPHYRPEREFQGQKFVHHLSKEAEWNDWFIEGFQFRDTGISDATKGVASVHVVRSSGNFLHTKQYTHSADIYFCFVMQGTFRLETDRHDIKQLKKGDAYVIPPSTKHELLEVSGDLEMLVVVLPGDFEMRV